MNESERKAVFSTVPILADFISVMLQDLQHTESDESCTDEREQRDTGTIYDCPSETFQTCQTYCERFMAECADDIETVLDAGDSNDSDWLRANGFEYLRNPERFTHGGIGSTLYLASVGHGVTFTDDGNAPCLERLAQWARDNRFGEPYLGDDSRVYII